MRSLGARLAAWRSRVAALRTEVVALYLASRDPRVPRHAKVVAALVAAYALSPIDLVPDFVPVLGYLDDLLVIWLGVSLAIRLIPADLHAEHRAAAASRLSGNRPRSRAGVAIVLGTWIVALAALAAIVWRVQR